jgi:hypothetical protein
VKRCAAFAVPEALPVLLLRLTRMLLLLLLLLMMMMIGFVVAVALDL